MYNIKQLKWSIIIALIISGGMIGGAAAFAQSETNAEQVQAQAGITFPIPELGSCADKASCKAYCDESDHMTECVAFAQAHGLMDKEEGVRAKKFASRVAAGDGPGGCSSPGMCKAYCEDITHIDACVAFAEKHDFKGESFEHGKKIGVFLKSGGKMPGGCTSRASCEEYCSNFSHAQECFTFAQKAGIDQSLNSEDKHGKMGEPQRMPTQEQMQKLQSLAEAGETPGGCKTKDECMQYCRGDGHRDECIVFAQKAGFMSKNEAEMAKKFHGGPGGCDSQESCHAFCNDSANRETCFTFAKENGLIPEAQLTEMKEGLVRMREGITNAPEEVQSCLKTTLGEKIIDDIQSGNFIPGPDIGEKMRGCFEKFGGHHDPKKIFNEAPPQVVSCLKEKLGADFERVRSGTTPPTPEIADSFRMCFQQMEMNDHEQGSNGKQGGMPDPEKLKMYLRSAPPEVSACLKEKLGDQFDKLLSGEVMPTPELGQHMQTCFQQFRPQGSTQGKMMGGMPPMQGGDRGDMVNHVPPQVLSCLKEKLDADKFTQMGSGQMTPEIEQSMRACFELLGGQKGISPQGIPPTQVRAPMNPDILSRTPPEIQACLKEKLGAEKFAQLGSGVPTADLKIVMTACFEQFGKPAGAPDMGSQSMPQGAPLQGSGAVNWQSRLPQTVQVCLKTKVGDEAFLTIGETLPTPAISQIVKDCFIASGSFPGTTGAPNMLPPTNMPPPLPMDGSQLPPINMNTSMPPETAP
jgi:hypothetical protein